MLHILLTFDYELYFNDCEYGEEEVLIQPTDLIAQCLEANGIHGTFFIDTPSICRFKDYKIEEYPSLVRRQVRRLLDSNHDIQLHIHPIWEKAKYDGSKWEFNNSFYSLSAFSNVRDIITKCKLELDSLAGGHKNYCCCAYRSGGFCIQPEEQVLEALRYNNIVIDSSVCKNLVMNTIAQQFDYTCVPSNSNWYISPQKGVKDAVEYGPEVLFEIPIGTYSKIPQKWKLTHGEPALNYPKDKGKHTPVYENKNRRKINQILYRINRAITCPVLFTMDSLHQDALVRIAKYYASLSDSKEAEIYVCAIAHPKFASLSSIKNMGRFIERVKNEIKNVDFITMHDVFKQFKGEGKW